MGHVFQHQVILVISAIVMRGSTVNCASSLMLALPVPAGMVQLVTVWRMTLIVIAAGFILGRHVKVSSTNVVRIRAKMEQPVNLMSLNQRTGYPVDVCQDLVAFFVRMTSMNASHSRVKMAVHALKGSQELGTPVNVK